jgi:hypothetical protein
MTDNKTQKSSEKLSVPIPVRLWQEEKSQLERYEASGLNISEIVRRCIRKALPTVIREIREELGRSMDSTSKDNPAFQSNEERYRPITEAAVEGARKSVKEIEKKTK